MDRVVDASGNAADQTSDEPVFPAGIAVATEQGDYRWELGKRNFDWGGESRVCGL